MPAREERVRQLEIDFARLTERLEGHAEALEIARSTIDRRLNGMNELREQINRERSDYVGQEAYQQRHEDLQRRIGSLEVWRGNVTGRVVGVGIISVLFVATVTAVATHALG
jgi:predicted  nucleic acid-binding Zn-ribbon protein